jgi:hypothetical protein
MPGRDRTGPRGSGPMMGRRAGYCAGYILPGYANPGYGMRFGRQISLGGRHGWRHWYFATGQPGWAQTGTGPVYPQQELAALKNEAEWLENRLGVIKQRIEELERQLE